MKGAVISEVVANYTAEHNTHPMTTDVLPCSRTSRRRELQNAVAEENGIGVRYVCIREANKIPRIFLVTILQVLEYDASDKLHTLRYEDGTTVKRSLPLCTMRPHGRPL
eukprot:GHVT01018812.1.p2 GENE.GHVT01018812.1~~GHVT01018812.1.p2  ORF type:complete len:109 (-),score=1.28 GHVT01018812.1:1256-1582(-)